MPIIGVDTGGWDPNPKVPIIIVAVRLSKKSGQIDRVVRLTPQQQSRYRSCMENWAEKLAASLIFQAIKTIYSSGDAIEIDIDFHYDRRKYVLAYLAKLFSVKYMGHSPMNSPAIAFHSRRESPIVKLADKKCEKAREGKMPIYVDDPSLMADMSLLPRTISPITLI